MINITLIIGKIVFDEAKLDEIFDYSKRME